MKKLLVLFFIISYFSIAQTKEHPTTFVYELNEETGFSIFNDYVVIYTGKKAIDVYKNVLLNIKSLYNNPSEVITATEEGTFIKVSGIASDLFVYSAVGMGRSNDVHYNLELYFKDDRIKIEISRLDYYAPPSQYSSGGFYQAKKIDTHRKNGKPKKMYSGTTERISNYFNEIILSFMKEAEATKDDGDW